MIDRPRLRWASRWDPAAPYLFLAPFALIFAVFTVLPSVATFVLAWWQWDPLGARTWVGAANFERLAADPRFWTATTNTLAIAAAATIVQVGIALGLAHLVHRVAGRAVGALRVSLLVPFVTSGAAVTILVAQLLDRDYGSVNRLLDALGYPHVDVLAPPWGAWAVVTGIVVWRTFGFTTLLMLAVLSATPRDVFRAAELDGAGGWAQFRHLSLPLLGPVIAFSVVTSVTGALQLFTEPLLLDPTGVTCGPARQCQTLALLVYEVGFRDFQFGYAAAVATAVFAIAGAAVGAAALVAGRRLGWTT
ncbi:sugar ABC transporter permease [Microbacterium sp. CFH 31415]|uniref:carbohydrate ABC transporter permease n=1 Tax=Microbacterium sp. CFH 31415 TaxID=2921732 RepID=UPI001F1441C6|nr:sugar ABC transporter permease [Microbacterium sp. CFH 31415]MCH6231466.1 sugar ABC transporter permease [Microbacterium sp. CFH 31415]